MAQFTNVKLGGKTFFLPQVADKTPDDLPYIESTAKQELNIVASAGVKLNGFQPAIYRIAEALPTGTSFIQFNSIPQTFRHLRLVLVGRATGSNTFESVFLRMNGDAGANYQIQRLYGTGTTAGADELAGQTSGLVGYVTGGAVAAGVASAFEADILDYARTSFHKPWLSTMIRRQGGNTTGVTVTVVIGGAWNNTAAVTSLELLLGANQFAAGTYAALYGVP